MHHQLAIDRNAGANEKKLPQEDGFSSDEQQDEEIIYSMPENIQDLKVQNDNDNKIKFLSTEIRDVVSKSYSLEPDMINGWVPKIQLPKPVPLIFRNDQFDQIIEQFIKKQKFSIHGQQSKEGNQHVQLCYLGTRYESTYYAWYDKEFQFPYKHLNAPKNITFTDRFFVGQHWDAQSGNILQFDSLFESGNLDCVIKVEQNQYDLFMRVDSNTRGHLQWFNFKLRGLEPQKIYKLNICNFQKGKNLYTRGMRPYCYSLQKYLHQGIGWHQIQGTAKYRKKTSKSQKTLEYQSESKFYQLSFQVSSDYPEDEIQLAYCVPYTYTRMKKFLSQILDENHSRNILSLKKLCNSLGGHAVDELTITQNAEEEELNFKNKIKTSKKIIFVTGRCHPGESNGSWMVEGLIDYLCNKTEASNFLRKTTIFKIVPMLNPDGVILGNYRTGLFGKDFNRQFNNPDKDIFPQIYHLKSMFWNYKQIYGENAFIYLDFHGHSIKKNVFAYGPEYPISHKNYYESRMIAKLIAMKSKMFRYHSCIFKIAEFKESTGRATFLKSHKIPFTFTIEASNGSYFDKDVSQDADFDERKWKQVGQQVIVGLYQYLKILAELQRIRNEKMNARKQAMLKNRQKVKIKRGKGSKMGYFTSMGFRKCKTSNNQDIEPMKVLDTAHESSLFETFDFQINSLEICENLNSLYKQIKNQETLEGKIEQKQKLSDDQISEGNSDSEGSSDDLDPNLQNELLNSIKDKKKKKWNKKITQESSPPKLHSQNQSKREIPQQKQVQEKISKNNLKINSKDIIVRKCFGKKKSSVFGSLSPKKQEPNSSLAAKIVNFNFSLNPIECTTTQTNFSNQNEMHLNPNFPIAVNAFNSTFYTSKSSSNCLFLKGEQKGMKLNQFSKNRKTNGQKGMEYSQTFKKTFISVQKQIIRRDNHKRYLVSMNNSQNHAKTKKNWVVQNVRGKRIGLAEAQISQIERQSQVKSRSPEKNFETKSSIKPSSRLSKNTRRPQRELIIIEDFTSTELRNQEIRQRFQTEKQHSQPLSQERTPSQLL